MNILKSVFKVSVIIPVYNAEQFLTRAVDSALQFNVVKEIILIEDKSPDNALKFCHQLAKEHQKVKVYRHPNGENRGAGASRNLGIEKAKYDYIAFLDADDWYLPNRFDYEKEYLLENDFDGIYGATGYYFEDKNIYGKNLTTIQPKVAPKKLTYHLLFKKGHFHLNALTVRREKLLEVGCFDTSLRLHQDTHLSFKLSHHSDLIGGIIDKPIAVRRVHSENRIANQTLRSRAQLRIKLYKTFKNYNNVGPAIMKKMKMDFLRLTYLYPFYNIRQKFKEK